MRGPWSEYGAASSFGKLAAYRLGPFRAGIRLADSPLLSAAMAAMVKDRGFGVRQGGGIMSRDGGWSRRNREGMRMTAVKTVPRAVVQKGSRAVEDDEKAKRELAPGCPVLTGRVF